MSETDVPPWERELCEAIAEVMAADAEAISGVDVEGLKAPLRSLLDIFGCRPEVREKGRLRLVRRLNQDPINIAAMRWLPIDWGSEDTLRVLSLMLWGASEANTVPDYWETSDVAAETVARMMKWNPAYVMAMLQNPENPENAHEETSLTANDLTNQDNAIDAAWILMDQLQIALRNRDH